MSEVLITYGFFGRLALSLLFREQETEKRAHE